MWWPLANFKEGQGPGGKAYTPQIDTGQYDFVHVLEDIQSLNERAERNELEITAISIHQYPFIADRYALTRCGSSMGDQYGPLIVAKPGLTLADLPGKRLAIPGWRTTAWLVCQLMMRDAGIDPASVAVEVVPFDQIIHRVVDGSFDGGLIIHEGQITYQNNGLISVADTGVWWHDRHNLPLPLGGNAIRRDVPDAPVVCRILLDSIQHALDNREAAIEYALNYARDMESDLADRFVGMYVNDLTLDYGEKGEKAVKTLIQEGMDAGLLPANTPLDMISPK